MGSRAAHFILLLQEELESHIILRLLQLLPGAYLVFELESVHVVWHVVERVIHLGSLPRLALFDKSLFLYRFALKFVIF